MLSLRFKMTMTLLLMGLLSAVLVAGFARWMVVREFNSVVMSQAFERWQDGVTAYIETYGSYEEAWKHEDFPSFVRRRVGNGQNRPEREGLSLPNPRPVVNNRPAPVSGGPRPAPQGDDRPPFIFTVVSTDGIILHAGENREARGQPAERGWKRRAKPIVVNGEIAVYGLTKGEVILREQDEAYLLALRNALVYGIGAASVVALIFGLLFGTRLSSPLRRLTLAVRSMNKENLEQAVDIDQNDEIGELARVFNTKSRELADVHGQLESKYNELQTLHEQLHAQAEQLKEMSVRDELTGLYNRRYFNSHTSQAFETAKRYNHPLSMMIGDIDNFKQVNDRFSHAVGDEVLKQVAKLIDEHTRASDIVARYGGEEFVIAFPETGLADAMAACEKIRHSIESFDWQNIHADLIVTMSMGLAEGINLAADDRIESHERLIQFADHELYKAKHMGKNRVSYTSLETYAFN